jgi:hypothetical protein
MKSRWIVHKGVVILYGDFSGFQKDVKGLRAEVDAADAEILRKPKGSVLAIADLTGTVTTGEVVELFKASATKTKDFIRKQAVVGVTGIQKVLARAVAFFSGQSMHLFDSVDQAKDWLAGAGEEEGEEISADIRT